MLSRPDFLINLHIICNSQIIRVFHHNEIKFCMVYHIPLNDFS